MASSRIKSDLIRDKLLDQEEISQILDRTSKKMFAMKIPDMEYLVLNTFEDLKKKYFFQP
jgi:hypothetical protein